MSLTESAFVAEKQARIRTIASLMGTADYLTLVTANEMGHFSREETALLNEAVDMIQHWIRLATAQT